MDYTRFTYLYTIGSYTSKPKPLKPFLKAVEPLDSFSWIGFLVSAICISVMTILVIRVNPSLEPIKKSTSPVTV